jgi:hypothetical protein
MNEKIKEPYYSLMYKASEGWNDHLFQVPPELLEKFAEMIVRECVGVNYNSAFKEGEFCARELLEHFGVEE